MCRFGDFLRCFDHQNWAPIVEIVFDGQDGKLLEKDSTSGEFVLRDPTREHPVEEWFIKLMEALKFHER